MEGSERNIILSKFHIRNEVPVVQYNINIHYDMTWKVFIYGHEIEIPGCLEITHLNNVNDIHDLIRKLESMKVCQGNPDANLVSCRYHKLMFYHLKTRCFAAS